jgi:hypothetical protein
VADVEIIYLNRKKQETDITLETDLTIYSPTNCNFIKKSNNKIEKNDFKTKKSFFGFKKTSCLITCLVITTIILSYSFNAGYIPIKYFLEIKEPIGNTTEINIEEAAEKYSFPISPIPVFNNVKYKIFGTDQRISIIEEYYMNELKNDGFKLEYIGTENIKGFDLSYYGFTKGITAVVIIMSTDDIYIDHYETLVLYSTGSIFDYSEILRENRVFLGL